MPPLRSHTVALTAEQADKLGLINDVHAPEDLRDRAVAMARNLAKGSPEAQALAKSLLDRSLASSQGEMTDAECAAQEAVRYTEFHREAVRRFLAKEPRLYDWDQLSAAG